MQNTQIHCQFLISFRFECYDLRRLPLKKIVIRKFYALWLWHEYTILNWIHENRILWIACVPSRHDVSESLEGHLWIIVILCAVVKMIWLLFTLNSSDSFFVVGHVHRSCERTKTFIFRSLNSILRSDYYILYDYNCPLISQWRPDWVIGQWTLEHELFMNWIR